MTDGVDGGWDCNLSEHTPTPNSQHKGDSLPRRGKWGMEGGVRAGGGCELPLDWTKQQQKQQIFFFVVVVCLFFL